MRSVFSALNKEGKALPQPSEEEIVAFARNNQFISRHDVTIPDNKRAMLVKRWQKAEMERPSGGAFHAWKHTLVESVVRWRRSFAAVGLAGAVAFTSACSGGSISENSPVPTSSPTSITQTTEAPQPSATATVPMESAPAGQLTKNSKGEYLQATIADDDAAMQVNPTTVDPSAYNTYTKADVAEAQKVVVKFIAEEGMDSSINGDPSNLGSWWEKNKAKVAPEYQDSFYADLEAKKSPVVTQQWQEEKYNGEYQYVYNPKETRVVNRSIAVNSIYAPQPDSLAIIADVNYGMKVKPGVGVTKSGVQNTVGTMAYSVRKDAATGSWLINGYQTKVDTTEG